MTGDWTATVLVAMLIDDRLPPPLHKRFAILDARRMRGTPDEVRRFILDVTAGHASIEQEHRLPVITYFPEDPGQAGKMQSQDLTALLLGQPVFFERQSGPKTTRAAPAAAAVNEGLLGMLKAEWNRVLVDELAGFPFGRHDDLVDALAIAFNKLTDGTAEWLLL